MMDKELFDRLVANIKLDNCTEAIRSNDMGKAKPFAKLYVSFGYCQTVQDQQMTLNFLKKTIKYINKVLSSTIILLMATMVVIVVLNVLLRYVFSYTLTWSAELARYCMVWSAFLGAAVLVNQQKHIAITLLGSLNRQTIKKGIQIIIHSGSFLFFVILIIWGIQLVVLTTGQTAASIPFLPMNWVYSVIPLSALLMAFGSFVSTLRVWYEK